MIQTADIKSFVLLKYKILTGDFTTWHFCETYPAEVQKSWAWRCAEDVEHLATTKESKELYRVARLYSDGLATKEELTAAYGAGYHSDTGAAHRAAYYAAISTDGMAASSCAYYAASTNTKKWSIYKSWLIEELCKYEEQQGTA